MEYIGSYRKYYPADSMGFVLDELPMAMGWAMINVGQEKDGWLNFNQVRRQGEGYIKQQVKSILAKK